MGETTGNQSGESRDADHVGLAAASGSTFPELDVSLLEHSLSMTPWERMRANDDALNFAESLRVAMLKRDQSRHRAAVD